MFQESTPTATAGLVETPTDGTPIDIGDGKTRTLRFTVGKLKALKKKFGLSIMRGGLRNLDEDQLPEIIRAGLEGPESEKPSIAWFDENIDIKRVPALIEAIGAAWFKNQPKNEPPLTVEDLATLKVLVAEMEAYATRTKEAIALMEATAEAAKTTTAE